MFETLILLGIEVGPMAEDIAIKVLNLKTIAEDQLIILDDVSNDESNHDLDFVLVGKFLQ